jgi:acetate---CoA ligase (ADP-forming)
MSSLPFLTPRAVAIIGASTERTKRGYRAIESLQKAGFEGGIYPVNPRATEILGLRVHPDIASLPEGIDLALVCTAAATVPEILEQCGRKNIRGAVVLALGFGEGGEEGRKLEQRAVDAARTAGIRFIGPNTSGIFNAHCGLNLVGFSDLRAGGIGIISQSGNMALALATEGHLNGHVGFSTYIGVGNEADLRFHDYLAHMGSDLHTQAVALYVEGFRDAIAFLDTAEVVARRKPLVMYKGGRTETGRNAVRSHTGSLAGNYAIARSCLRQAGVVVVDRSDALLPVTEALSLLPSLRSRRIAVLADGGGHATIAADALVQAGLELCELGAATRNRLAAVLLPIASMVNPVDIASTADAGPGVIAECADILLADPQVDGLLVVGMFGGFAIRFSETLAHAEAAGGRRIAGLVAKFGKPIVVHSIFAPLQPEALQHVRRGGIPVHDSIEMAALTLGMLAERSDWLRRPPRVPRVAPPSVPHRAQAIVGDARAKGRAALTEIEAFELLAAHGIAIPPMQVAPGADDAARVAERFGDAPLAFKIISPDILHKSDIGGVLLDVRGLREIQVGLAALVRTVRQRAPDANVRGVLVMPMAPAGVEVIVGMTRDPQYGAIMMFGLGGVHVETMRDVAFRRLPLTHDDALDLMAEIQGQPFLDGTRGRAGVDRALLATLIARISDVCLAHPEIAELDLNPVIAGADECWIVDARILLTR